MKFIKKIKVSWLKVALFIVFLSSILFEAAAQCGANLPEKLVYIAKDLENPNATNLQDVTLPLSIGAENADISWKIDAKPEWFDFSNKLKPKFLLSNLNYFRDAPLTLRLTAVCGVKIDEQKEIKIVIFPAVHPRNALTGNSDSVNDLWDIVNLEKFTENPLPKVRIFDRWGSIVFESKFGYRIGVETGSADTNKSALDRFAGFDQRTNKFLPTGTYVYSIIPHPDYPEIIGELTLIR